MIMLEGVAVSKSLAAVHIQDNKLSHWCRMRIYATLTRSVKLTEEGKPDFDQLAMDDSIMQGDMKNGHDGNNPSNDEAI